MKLYLAGPMRGIKHYNFPNFDEVTSCLTDEGYVVVSPAQYDRDHGFDPVKLDLTGDEDLAELNFDLKAALAHDLDVVCTEVDGVALLDGWEHSSGARAEVAAALALGVPVKPWHCWDDARTCHRHLVTELPQRARAAEQAAWHYGFEQTSSRHDAHPDSTHERLARERERGVPAGHVHFATDKLVSGCEACDKMRDAVARAALDGDFDTPSLSRLAEKIGEAVAEDVMDGGAVRVTSSTGGQKGQKLAQLGAIDPDALLALAEVAGFGAQKYARNNYLLGYDWSLAFDALMRHALRFWGGEDIDPESGQPHMAHCAWLSLALVSFMLHELGTDDRWKASS